MVRSEVVFALTVFACAAPAVEGQGMTFRYVNDLFGVLAQGNIEEDTPAKFAAFLQGMHLARTVWFNSGGGDLSAGLELGRLIRRAGWHTGVGTPSTGTGITAIFGNPGECDSACTFAFLGGASRSIGAGSRFGVHRFSGQIKGDPLQVAQIAAGELVAYIREMGVSTEMYTLMTKGDPKDPNLVIYLDLSTMTRLNITTSYNVDARMTDDRGVSVLHLMKTESNGKTHDEISFYCNGARLLARATFGGSLPPQFSLEWAFQPSGRRVPIAAGDYSVRSTGDGRIAIEVYVTPALLRDWILTADFIEVRLTGPSSRVGSFSHPNTSYTLEDIRTDLVGPIPNTPFRTLVKTVASACR